MRHKILLLSTIMLLACITGCGSAGLYSPGVDSGSGTVSLSHPSGIYPEEFLLTMDANGEVYYTTDGSDPSVSQTALLYTAPLPITDRANDENVVSAVPPVSIAGSNNQPTSNGDGFTCTISAPDREDVDKCTVIRAVCRDSQGNFSGEVCATYFIGTAEAHIRGLAESCAAAEQPLAVISIAMNFGDLFDPNTGIYVKGITFRQDLTRYLNQGNRAHDGETARSLDANYKQRGRQWEREAVITMFEFSPEGVSPVLTQGCGIRIQGNYSRSDLQKGLRLYARSEYGGSSFRYAVFGTDYKNDFGQVMDKFDTLVLRAGGNCAFTAKFNDIYWQTLSRDSACETKRSRPCVVYLNGEYWGLYVLEEDYSDDYFEDKHGIRKEHVLVYKGDAETYPIGYKLDVGQLPEGEEADYYFRELYDFFNRHESLETPEDFDAFCRLVDPQSVMDYFAIQIWINNKWDWPGKNWSMWKTSVADRSNPYADGRWRFIFYDMEFGGVSGAWDARTNTIKEDNYKPLGLLDKNTDNPAVLCFAYLMTNELWRQQFYDRLLELSDGAFSKDNALAVLQSFQDTYAPLYPQFFARYPGTGSSGNAVNGGYASIRCIRDFLEHRQDYIPTMIDWCRKILD